MVSRAVCRRNPIRPLLALLLLGGPGCAGQASASTPSGATPEPTSPPVSTAASAAGGTASTPPDQASGGTASVSAPTGGSPASSPTGNASGGQPPTGPDPTLFNWPEATADGGTEQLCKPGHYVGTFRCDVHAPGAVADASFFTTSGPIDLTLDQSQDGEFLEVSGGTLTATSSGIFQLGAMVQGKLDCLNGAFAGNLQNGTVSIPPFPSGGSFSGPINGSFSQSGPALNGTWTLIGGTTFQGLSCTGTWSAAWQSS